MALEERVARALQRRQPSNAERGRAGVIRVLEEFTDHGEAKFIVTEDLANGAYRAARVMYKADRPGHPLPPSVTRILESNMLEGHCDSSCRDPGIGT